MAAFYFDLLIQTKDYLYARKLIASYDFSDLFEQLMVEKIQQAENFTSQNDRQKIRKIHLSVEKMPTMPPAEQLLVVSEIEELPYHELVQTIKKMIILPEIHLLVRAKMLRVTRASEETPASCLFNDGSDVYRSHTCNITKTRKAEGL